MRKYRITGLLLLAAMLLFMSGPAAAQVFNAASDFSPTANPNGAWSYGQSASRGTAFNLYPYAYNYTYYYGDDLDRWTRDGIPYVFHNRDTVVNGGSVGAPVPAGGLGFHPGPSGENSIVRWTAPASGLYKVRAAFAGLNYGNNPDGGAPAGTTSDVAVLYNGTTQLFAGNVNGFGCPNAQSFSGTVSVLAGDTIDFTVGYGPDFNYGSDGTGLDAVITPESQVLTSDVTNLINGSNLSAQQKSQLNAQVSAIETSLTSGHKAAAIGKLQALVGNILVFMWSNPPLVPAALGNQLITDANEAIAILSS